MRIRTKRVKIVLLLAAVLTFLAGCSGGTSGNNANKGNNENSVVEGTKEPVTVSLYLSPGPIPMVSGIQDDSVAKEIERVTGVKMNIEVAASNDKLTTMIATGDLPDLTIVSPEFIDPLIKAGNILDLSPYIKNAPNILKNGSAAIAYSRDKFGDGTEGLFTLPARAKSQASPIADSQNGLFLRWDYYKELGYPQIQNEDELIKVVGEMVKNHPETPDGKKVYGFAAWSGAYKSTTFYKKYSGLYDFGAFANYNVNTSEFISILDDRNLVWRSAGVFNKAMIAGLLDPESFTQKLDQALQKINDGRVMTISAEWLTKGVNPSLAVSSQGSAYYEDVPMPDTPEYTAMYDRKVPFGYAGRLFIVSSKTKHPEAIVKLLDYLYSEEGARTILTGVKGVTWTDDGGKAKLTGEALAGIKGDPNYKAALGIHKYEGIVGLDYDSFSENGQLLDLFLDPDSQSATYTAADKDYIQHYGVEAKLDVIGNRKNKMTVNEGVPSLIPVPDSDQKRIEAKLNDYLTQEVVKLIMTKDEASFNAQKEKMKAELIKLKIEPILEFYKKGFEAALKKVDSYK